MMVQILKAPSVIILNNPSYGGESCVSLKLELWVENKNVCVSLTQLFNPSGAPQMNLKGHKMVQAVFFALNWCIAATVFVCTPL